MLHWMGKMHHPCLALIATEHIITYQFSIVRKYRKLMTQFTFPQIYSLIYLIHLIQHSTDYVIIMLRDDKWKREFNNTMV